MSTKEQELGPGAQSEALSSWAAREGMELLAIFLDAWVGGGTQVGDRPGLVAGHAALQSLSAGTLIAANRGRIARDIEIVRSTEREALNWGAVLRTADGMSDTDDEAGHIT